MQNTKILKITFGAVVLIMSVYSLWTEDFTYQNITLFFLGLFMSVLGVEESKKNRGSALECLCFYGNCPVRNAVDPVCDGVYLVDSNGCRMNTECIRAVTPVQRSGFTSKS